jgi:hypothetical protein
MCVGQRVVSLLVSVLAEENLTQVVIHIREINPLLVDAPEDGHQDGRFVIILLKERRDENL